MSEAEKRRKLVAGIVAFTEDTSIAASGYERYLLDKYASGMLSIDEVLMLLSANERECQAPPEGLE